MMGYWSLRLKFMGVHYRVGEMGGGVESGERGE